MPVTRVHTSVRVGVTVFSCVLLAVLALACSSAHAAEAASGCANSAYHGFSPSLPDCRAYELVSAPDEGEPYVPAYVIGQGDLHSPAFRTTLGSRAATDGEALAYVGDSSTTNGSGKEDHNSDGNSWLSRHTATGWSAEDITPNENNFSPFQSFSEDDETGFYTETGRKVPVSAEVERGCNALYARSSSTGMFEPAFTAGQGEPGFSYSPNTCGTPLFAGATTDDSQIIFQSEAALTPESREVTEGDMPPGREEHDASNGQEECTVGCNLYISNDGLLKSVNVLDGVPVPGASFGGYPSQSSEEEPDFSNVISNDGSRIFWTDTQAGEHFSQIYVLEDGTENVPVSGSEPAEYWTATPDGRYAYYTEGGALWRFDTANNTREHLIETSAAVQGVIGTNQVGQNGQQGEGDGEYLYFVANGVLTSTPSPRGEEATPGSCPDPTARGFGEYSRGCNLYLLHDGSVIFIARLSASDDHLHSANGGFNQFGGDWQSGLGERLAEVTPNGRNLVFESLNGLTKYPRNPNLSIKQEEPQVFIYSTEDGTLACASCSPTGEPQPRGVAGGMEEEQTKLTISATAASYMHRWISDDGSRAFFDSNQALVPGATNGVQNVYEWERPAMGDGQSNTCTARKVSPLTDGCTFLLSDGTNEYDAFLIDADATGENVFFEQVGSIGSVQAPLGHNEVYDARVDGGIAEASQACTATGCQGVPAAPPIFATPTSVTFNGTGNFPAQSAPVKKAIPKTAAEHRAEHLTRALKTCKRDRSRRKRDGCEREARAKYGAAEHKRETKGSSETGRGK